ncbi:gliding motility-associated C-terminal domain-containing protein [Tamlana sp. 62-3]|uniref:Gliding motility-associated C-terminal domain-containing protein n=1 Tax=Neotamlana sargassicola TaxID=2883125 RepID=A0A9X1I4R7_9FLAO|nr:gliding motility-associated C-terminal domain-containing protein [Tamlana sargassicola]MCB4806815.1 gliding motility-associated C-terminal domain-containing protein [Tamlana sargassicola]
MKTKSLVRLPSLIGSFFVVFLWMTFSLNAQCPTVTNPAPPAICDASGYTFSDLRTDYVTDGGNGIVWYDSDTGGNLINNNQLVQEGTYYADDNSGSCGTRQSIVVNFQVNASGGNFDQIYCSNENATVQNYIDDVLSSEIPSGGSVEVYNDPELTDQANTSDSLPSGAKSYYIVFVDNSGCKSQIEVGQVGVFDSPANPAPANPQTFCSDTNPTIADLNPGTSETNYSWYANVDGLGEPIPPALSNATVLIDGNTYYIQINSFFCTSDAVGVMVEIYDPVDAGSSSTLEYCSDNLPPAFDLYDELGGSPETSGTWSGPLTTSNGYQGTVDISSLTTAGNYVFTYTVLSNNDCPDATATVTITINETRSAGNASAANPESFCESNLPTSFDLFTLLENHDLGGSWTQGTLITDPVVTSPIDLTGFTSGTYNFTYFQNVAPNPCPEELTTVQVIILDNPDAGAAINQVFCENELSANSPFNLFDALDGSQDHDSGTWTDASDNTISNNLDITTLTVAGSPYTFNYTIDNGTCSDTEPITITVEEAPESGTANAPAEFCEGAAPTSYNLFDLLENEDQTGSWSDDSNSGVLTGNTVDLSGLTPSTYNFTYNVDAIGSCDDVDVTVSIVINPLPNAGIPTPGIFCENDLASNSPLDLFDQLSGEDAGGTWSDDDASGALSGSDLDLTALMIGTYNFTYTVTNSFSCTDSSTVAITIEEAPESGTANAPAQFCEGAAPTSYNLFDLLENEDQTGSWSDDSNSGVLTGNTVDLSGLTPSTYNFTYNVDAIGSCDDVDVTVSIVINPLPNAGTPTPGIFCENDLASNSPLDLFDQLAGEDAGGTWSDDDASGALSGSDLDLTALMIGTYNFTYTVTNSFSCTDSSTVAITIEEAPESGTANAPAEFCLAAITAGQTYNLFDLLEDEDQTGTWSDDDATGALTGNTIALDALSAGSYNFTFDVDAIGSCDDVNVTVSIVINETAAPTANGTQTFCDSATVADLVATGNGIQWYINNTGGTALSATFNLTSGQTYYASQTDAITGCESAARTAVTVTIYSSPNAGAPNTASIISCNNNSNIDLFTGLDGSQDAGGTWNNDDNVGSLSGSIFDASGIDGGVYEFTYSVAATAPCSSDSVTIQVTVEEPLNAGTDGTPLDLCSNNGTVDLFSELGGTPETGGIWTPALASGTGVFDPLVDAPGTYTYSLSNVCGTASSSIDVSVTLAPNAGSDNSITLCTSDDAVDLFDLLGVDAQSGGSWSPALTSGTGVFDPAVDAANVYTYTVLATSPCSPDSEASITVTVNETPTPTTDNSTPEFCAVNNPIVSDLDDLITSTGTIQWYEDAALTIALTGTEALIDGEDYYATQTNSTGCESAQAVQIDVVINDAETPSLTNPNEEYCLNDGPTISTLTNNLTYDSSIYGVLWYDAEIGGSTIPSITEISNSTYYATFVDLNTGCESSVRLAVSPNTTACGKVELPDGFSPNGDGVNDTFEVDNLAILYPNFEIEIYNRNGNIVYKGNASTPRFDGTPNQSRVVVNGDLPVGVYFYIFKYNDGEHAPQQGRLYLSR